MYKTPDTCWIVAYHEDEAVGIGGARIFDVEGIKQVYMARGYIEPSWRGTGLIDELGIARWRWAISKGATESVLGTRWAMKAAIRFAARIGYEEFTPSGREPYCNDKAELYFKRSISWETVDSPRLAPPLPLSALAGSPPVE